MKFGGQEQLDYPARYPHANWEATVKVILPELPA